MPPATATARSDQLNSKQLGSSHFHLDHNGSAITLVSASQRRMTEADPSEILLDIETLKTFTFTRILSQGEWARSGPRCTQEATPSFPPHDLETT